MATVKITWPKGWMIIVAVPHVHFETSPNSFNRFAVDVHCECKFIDWVIVTATDIRIHSEAVA